MFRDAAFYDFKENIFKLIGKESMLICAGTKENGFNMMTASWGFMGEMWGQESAAVVVRPQRYTMKFLEDNEYFTLNFMGDNKEVYKICGTKSGRDIDKCKETGLTPMGDDRYTYFSESRLVLLCKKKYMGKIEQDGFIDKDLIDKWYPQKDFHNLIIGSVERIYFKEPDSE